MENKEAGEFISVVRSDDRSTVMAYVPQAATVKLFNPSGIAYEGQWFDATTNKYSSAKLSDENGFLEATTPGDASPGVASPGSGDRVLVLRR